MTAVLGRCAQAKTLPRRRHLQTASAAAALAAGAVSRDRGHILDTPDLHPRARERPERALRPWARCACLRAARGAQLHVERADAEFLAPGGHILSRKHRRIGGGLVTIRLDLHATGHANDSLAPRKVRHVHEGVVEGGENVRDPEHNLPLANLRTQSRLCLDGGPLLLGRHCCWYGDVWRESWRVFEPCSA